MAEINPPVLFCGKCKTPLSWETLNTNGLISCPACWTPAYAAAFPALYREIEKGRQGDDLLVDSDASCFHHPAKKAVSSCDACGRFLCSLCEIQLTDRRLCPACIQAGKQKGKLRNLSRERILYDELALAIAIWPLLVFYFTIITAPIALFISIRYWKAPMSVVKRSHVRFVIAIVVALMQLAGWTWFFVWLATRS